MKLKRKSVAAIVFGLIAGAGFLPGQETSISWKDYGGGPDSSHFFPGKQITKSNVAGLRVAWSYPYGSITSSPLVVDNVMYTSGRNGSLVALDATTGKEIWIHDGLQGMTGRGLNYWESKDRKDRRIIFVVNNFLQEVDATTGKSIKTFGTNGGTDLRVGLGREKVTRIQSGTPGKVFENLILLGSATGEGYISPPGDLRAYDILTGKLQWQFHTIPHPGEPGYETNPKDGWKYLGGANTWGEVTVDPVNALVFFPTGSLTYDFYGVDRLGSNLYGNCLIALDARTGKLKWYYQMVHHDLWDYDNVSAPQLTSVMHDGRKVDVVAQAGKTGFLYVFERLTGKPLWPIEERPVPASNMPGEKAWPTQPFPTLPPPFGRQKFTVDDINPFLLTVEEQASLRDRLASARNEGLFTPPGMTDTVQMPGNHGGANWGGTASNPTNGTVYIHSLDSPAFLKLNKVNPNPAADAAGGRGAGRGGPAFVPADPTVAAGAAAAGASPVGDAAGAAAGAAAGGGGGRGGRGGAAAVPVVLPPGPVVETGPAIAPEPAVAGGGGRGGYIPYPDGVEQLDRYNSGYGLMPQIIKPPYSTLTAYDLNKGTIKWRVGVGDEAKTASMGVHNTGGLMPFKSGIVSTATGLVFIGGVDGFARAYDAETGEILWAGRMAPAASQHGVPVMYSVNGREYVALLSPGIGGGGRGGGNAAPIPDDVPRGIVVFALPENK